MESLSAIPRRVRIRSRGQLTIPRDIREALNIDEEEDLTVFRVGKVLVMTPKRLQRASLSKQIEREMKRRGLTLRDLIADLRTQRERYIEEVYPED